MASLRHLVPLALSVVLISVTGAVAVALTVQATDRAEQSHLADRQSLQATLGGLGKQYVLFSLKEGLDYASTGTWNLRPGDPADTARLQSFVTHAVLLNYGAALVDLGDHVLSSYAAGPGLPPASDPGYGPMVKALLAQKPDVSSVMRVGSLHIVAMGVPVSVDGAVKAVFVGFVRLDTSSLETYVRALHYGRTGRTYVVDSDGTVVASTNPAEIGNRFGSPRATTGVARGATGTYVDSRTHQVVAFSALGVGGWGGATVQSVNEFYGPLRAGSLRVELAIVALLVLAALLVVTLNHKREAARRRYQAQLAYQAAHDGLTGLYNRAVLHERLGQALSRARRRGTDVAVLYLDLDSFKPINDSQGHDIGDAVLIEVAHRLKSATRAEDTVARIGGDEFAILVEDCSSLADVETLAQRVIAVTSGPVALAEGIYRVGVSVGIAGSRGGIGDTEALLRDADVAMYRAKDAGGSRFQWSVAFEPVTQAR